MQIKKQLRIVPSKCQSVCAETGNLIRTGEPCLFDPSSRQVFCDKSKRYQGYTPLVAEDDQQED